QRVLIHYRTAITKLGSVIDIDGHARELLDHVFTGESRMPRGATRGDLDGSELLEVSFRDVAHLVEKHLATVERDSSLHGVAHGSWLLVNLLEHEMLEAALLRHDRIPGDPLNRRLHRVAFEIDYANGVLVDDRDLAVAEKENVACVLKNRWNVRSDEELAIAKTDNHRRALAHGDDRVGLIGVDDRECEDAA